MSCSTRTEDKEEQRQQVVVVAVVKEHLAVQALHTQEPSRKHDELCTTLWHWQEHYWHRRTSTTLGGNTGRTPILW